MGIRKAIGLGLGMESPQSTSLLLLLLIMAPLCARGGPVAPGARHLPFKSCSKTQVLTILVSDQTPQILRPGGNVSLYVEGVVDDPDPFHASLWELSVSKYVGGKDILLIEHVPLAFNTPPNPVVGEGQGRAESCNLKVKPKDTLITAKPCPYAPFKKGQPVSYSFDLRIPLEMPPGMFHIYLRGLKENKVVSCYYALIQIKQALTVITTEPAI